jgi:hypothetical protein
MYTRAIRVPTTPAHLQAKPKTVASVKWDCRDSETSASVSA